MPYITPLNVKPNKLKYCFVFPIVVTLILYMTFVNRILPLTTHFSLQIHSLNTAVIFSDMFFFLHVGNNRARCFQQCAIEMELVCQAKVSKKPFPFFVSTF